MAGAGGFEPPHGGIKIRCLTAWLRPNWCGSARTIIAAAASCNMLATNFSKDRHFPAKKLFGAFHADLSEFLSIPLAIRPEDPE